MDKTSACFYLAKKIIDCVIPCLQRILNSIRLQDVEMVSEDYASNLGLFVIKINDILDNGQPFGLHRGSRVASKVDSIVFVNNLSWNQGICIDSMKIRHTI